MEALCTQYSVNFGYLNEHKTLKSKHQADTGRLAAILQNRFRTIFKVKYNADLLQQHLHPLYRTQLIVCSVIYT